MSDAVFEIKNMTKTFGPTVANKNINLELHRGEIRGLIGENGSGKSTLLSQVAGLYPSDSGEMFLDGQPYEPHNPQEANEHKIAMVLQELGVIGNLSVAVNVFLGRTGQFTRFGILQEKKMREAAAAIFEEWNLPMPPLNARMGDMLIETRKMVEIARAMSIDPNILILDEVTQSLSLNNRDILYDLIKRVKEMGRSVILITHDVEEMIKITDTITVLRDGEVVGELESAHTTPNEVKSMMVGRQVDGDYYRKDNDVDYEDEVVLEASNVNVKEELEDVNFQLHKGEILAFCGLSDSGIHSIGKAVYGLSKLDKGTVQLNVEDTTIKTPMEALGHHMGYVPKDRDNEALMLDTSIRDNFTLPSLVELTGPVGYVSIRDMNKLSNDMVDKMSVKCTGIRQNVNALSGGNKQKVNLGRWLAKDLRVLIMDCPTRGVDVGVKAYIYELMREAKKDGISIILISDELTEAIGMADRLMVMKNGKITGEMRRDENFTEQAIIEVMI